MRKRILLLADALLFAALLTGCTLARPEVTDTVSRGDAFCGFWLVYDRWENLDSHVFDVDSQTEQMLLAYTQATDMEREMPAYVNRAGSSLGEVALAVGGKEGEESTLDIKGTLYLLKEKGQSVQEQADREIWLYGDVVQSFREGYIEIPEDAQNPGELTPGQNVTVYIPQQEIEVHGRELMELAQSAGVKLALKSESPRYVTITPVLQRPDGTLYPEENNRHHASVYDTCGYSHTQTLEQTQIINGKTIKNKVSAAVAIQMIDALQSVRLVEMNAQNMPVRTTEATLGDMRVWAKQQKPFLAGEDCGYVIVEEMYETAQGESYVKRTVYNPPQGDGYANLLHTFHFPLENGLTETASVNIAF